MPGKKIIAVFGATGAQGGSVAHALLQDGTYAVRALTRDTSKPEAVKLKEAGAEVVCADLDKKESLVAALTGAYGAFVVTNSWGSDSDKEVTQGKLVADLCKHLHLEHVVYSGLEHVKKATGGKLSVFHFDHKGEVEEYFHHLGSHMTSVRLPFYYENFLGEFKPKKSSDGKTFLLCLPMKDVPLDGMSVCDLGPVVVCILKSHSHYKGKTIGLSAGKLTVEQYAEIMSKVTGKPVKDAKMHPEEYEKMDIPGAKALAHMFHFYMTRPDRDVEITHKLNPKVKNFQQWMEENKDKFKDVC